MESLLTLSLSFFSRLKRRPAAGRTLPEVIGSQLSVAIQEDHAYAQRVDIIVSDAASDVIVEVVGCDVVGEKSVAVAVAGFVDVVDQTRRPGRQGLQGRHGDGGIHR